MQSIILFIQRFIHIYEFSVLYAVCSVGTVAVYRIDRIEQPCALNENHCWANCAFCAKINPSINGWKSLFSSSYSAALVWQVHCSLHNTHWNTLHRIALLCFALCCTAMEYYVHTQREKKTTTATENRSDMIQMNNKIVYCMKDHHGVSIKTSKKNTQRRQSDAEKDGERAKKCAHKTAQGNRVKTEKRQSAQCVCVCVCVC